jgi:hypothetical protein
METVTGRLILDEHVASVIEFMERSLPADRLEYVATRLPALAKVLWAEDRCASTEPSLICASQPTASECVLEHKCVGGDSAVAVGDCK